MCTYLLLYFFQDHKYVCVLACVIFYINVNQNSIFLDVIFSIEKMVDILLYNVSRFDVVDNSGKLVINQS